MRRILVIPTYFLLSCGGPQPAATSGATPSEPGAPAASEPGAPAASEPGAPATAASSADVVPPADGEGVTSQPPTEVATPPAGVAADCFGKALDLSALIARNACRAEGEGKSPPAGALSWATAPEKVTLASAGSTTVRVTGTNASKDVVTFDFALNCDPARGFRAKATAGAKTTLLPAGEEAVVGWSNWCDQTARCKKPLVRIALPPGGQVFMPLELHARERGLDAACKKTKSALLKPGPYALSFEVPLYSAPPSATGSLQITK
ncbi:MAG TPA: hypothetical protein PKA88_18985 [Polyangiaceae bacterium]|nr:hypothetical protein [Polyangiaceae bacterium]